MIEKLCNGHTVVHITNSTSNSGGNVRCFKCANRRKFDLRVGNLWSICFSFEDSTSFTVLPTQNILAIFEFCNKYLNLKKLVIFEIHKLPVLIS